LGNLQECEDQKSLLIQGPPGSGKSSVVWFWACLMAETSDIMWVHMIPGGFISCARLCQGKIRAFTTEFEFVARIIRECRSHTIILDGITKGEMNLIGAARMGIDRLDNIGGPLVIAVASSQLIIAVEHLEQLYIEELSMDSWTLDQYQQCCNDDNFYQQVEPMLGEGGEKEEKIINKYHYAGGSARWMFGFDVDRICCDIKKQIAKCDDFTKLIEDSSGPSSNVAVNHLRQKRGENHFIISNYVMRELVQKCDRSFIKALTNVSLIRGNPSFDGWIFEMDFLIQIREMCKDVNNPTLQLLNQDESNAEKWQGDGYQTFTHPAELKGRAFKHNMWLIPKKWNQGGYDAVELVDSESIRFVQVTRGETHDLKLHFMETFLRESELVESMTKVDVVFVVPLESSFTLPTYGNVIGSLTNWDFEQLKVLRIKRSSC
jgi:energy-coupling factor transporter ATP-binding protein EcfA2